MFSPTLRVALLHYLMIVKATLLEGSLGVLLPKPYGTAEAATRIGDRDHHGARSGDGRSPDR